MTAHPVRGSVFLWFYVVWSVALIVPAGLSCLMLNWHPTGLAIVIAVVAAVFALLNLACAGWLVTGSLAATRAALMVVPLGVIAGMSPVAVRAALPWETPGTGEGSPMAVLIQLVLFSAIFGACFGITGVVGWVWLMFAYDRLTPRLSQQAPPPATTAGSP